MYMWEDFFEIIKYINPECVDKEQLLKALDFRIDYDETVIDKLYEKKIINADEYIKYMGIVLEMKNDEIKYIKKRIEDAKNEAAIDFNLFHSKERAQEVSDKLNVAIKLERLHDIYCPDYVPDWDSQDRKYYVYLYHGEYGEKFEISDVQSGEYSTTFFPNSEIAQKVCDILNEDLKNKQKNN